MVLTLQYIRFTALISLLLVTVINYQFLNILLNQYAQVFVGIIILYTLYYVDTIAAFIMAIVVATAFIKLYRVNIPKIINVDSKESKNVSSNKEKADTNEITTMRLKDKNNFVGVKGVYGEEVYSSQGGHKEISGYSDL